MYKIGIIFFAFFALSQTLAGEFPAGIFRTPNEIYHYYDAKASSNESTPFSGHFRFKVRASNDTSISFSTRADNKSLEFIIGAQRNNETRIRVNGTYFVIMKTPQILNEYEFQTFEINWSKNIFHFAQIDEKSNDMNNLMLFKNKQIFPINYIGLKSNQNAEWLIRERESPRIFNSFIKTVNESGLLQIGNSLRCMVIETKNESRPIYVHTMSSPIEHKNYTYVQVPKQSCYNIFVRAKLDAHIAFTNSNNKIKPMIELHLRPQGLFNITFDYNSTQIGSQFVQSLLNDQEYRGYWIEFNSNTGNVTIGKIGESYFMARNIELFPIDYIGVLTSNGNVGDWIIKKYGTCPGDKDEDINNDGFWGDAKTRCYIENPPMN